VVKIVKGFVDIRIGGVVFVFYCVFEIVVVVCICSCDEGFAVEDVVLVDFIMSEEFCFGVYSFNFV